MKKMIFKRTKDLLGNKIIKVYQKKVSWLNKIGTIEKGKYELLFTPSMELITHSEMKCILEKMEEL